MAEFIGVKAASSFYKRPSIKREILLFDRVGLISSRESFTGLKRIQKELADSLIAEVEYLYEEGLVFDVDTTKDSELERDPKFSKLWDACKYHLDQVTKTSNEALLNQTIPGPAFFTNLELSLEYQVRARAMQLRILNQVDAYPAVSRLRTLEGEHGGKSDVVRITLNCLPTPDDNTPLEQIVEFRHDPDSRSKFLALRHWMSEVARAELAPAEVEEKLEYLIDQYQQHMKLHRMKTNVGTLETVVTTGAEVLGDLVSFKWGKAAKALFSLKCRRVDLLEGELTAPGNEVAYIVMAREMFESR